MNPQMRLSETLTLEYKRQIYIYKKKKNSIYIVKNITNVWKNIIGKFFPKYYREISFFYVTF